MSTFRAHFLVFAALIALTVLTTAVAYIDLGVLSVSVALTIAGVKALIVALYFMHLAHAKHRTQIVAAAGVLWVVILIAFSLSDVLTRHIWSPQTGW